MGKLTLVAPESFQAPVQVPLLGGGFADVTMTFRYRNRDQWNTFINDEMPQISGGAELVVAMCMGWDLEEPFSPDNVEALVCRYEGAPMAIFGVYADEIYRVRRGNWNRPPAS